LLNKNKQAPGRNLEPTGGRNPEPTERMELGFLNKISNLNQTAIIAQKP